MFTFQGTIDCVFLLKNEFDQENNEIRQFKTFEGVCRNKVEVASFYTLYVITVKENNSNNYVHCSQLYV